MRRNETDEVKLFSDINRYRVVTGTARGSDESKTEMLMPDPATMIILTLSPLGGTLSDQLIMLAFRTSRYLSSQ